MRQVLTTVVGLAVLGAVAIACVALIRGTWILTPILSGSMRPGLPVGGLAISERVPVDRLVVRDVIVFRDPNDPAKQIVHRIVRLRTSKSGQILINTRGDADTVRDPWTLTIRGRYAYMVRWTVPLVGYLGVAYQNNRGFVLLGIGVVLILVSGGIVLGSIRGNKRQAWEERRSAVPEISPPSSSDRRSGGPPRCPTKTRESAFSPTETELRLARSRSPRGAVRHGRRWPTVRRETSG